MKAEILARIDAKIHLQHELASINTQIDNYREELHLLHADQVAACEHIFEPAPRSGQRICSLCCAIFEGTRHVDTAHWSRTF